MRIDHDAIGGILLREGVIDKPVAIICIVGLMRTGKSFLLNFILRYLERRGVGKSRKAYLLTFDLIFFCIKWENTNWIGGDEVGVNSDSIVWRGGKQRVTQGIQVLGKIFQIPTPSGGELVNNAIDIPN